MSEKFWMIKGSLGMPVAAYHDKNTAIKRTEEIARESGKPAYLLEVVMVAHPVPQPVREVEVEWL